MHDPLTGAFTRQSGEEALNLLFRLNAMAEKTVDRSIFDLDRFKSVNDTWGHNGDRCLCALVNSLRQGLRRSDLLVRWGGEEFIALLPDTPSENVPALLQRLREKGLACVRWSAFNGIDWVLPTATKRVLNRGNRSSSWPTSGCIKRNPSVVIGW